MKASDLMIGDWLYALTKNGKKIARVCNVTDNFVAAEATDGSEYTGKQFDGVFSCIEPIPLSPEILEKNGFERNANDLDYRFIIDNIYCSIRKGVIYWYVNIYDISNSPHEPIFKAHIIHIHELQHALRLVGIEKEIKL